MSLQDKLLITFFLVSALAGACIGAHSARFEPDHVAVGFALGLAFGVLFGGFGLLVFWGVIL